MRLADVLPEPTPAMRAAHEVVTAYSSPSMVNHCARSHLWAASYGRMNAVDFDPELLHVAAMLHDLGLAEAFDNHGDPFEEAGGNVAWVFAAGAGWPTDRRLRAKEVIVRHMWDAVELASDAEGHLLHVATSFDISGRNAEAWPEGFQREVLDRHPRLSLPEEFLRSFEDQARRKPSCAAAAAVASGIGDRIAANPLDRVDAE
jgi:hypothetical protein